MITSAQNGMQGIEWGSGRDLGPSYGSGFVAGILCGTQRLPRAEDLFQGQKSLAAGVPFDSTDQALVGIRS